MLTIETLLPFALPVVALAIVLPALVALAKFGLFNRADPAPWPFHAKRPLTRPEQVLYHRLVNALPEYIILAQVQVSRVLGVSKGANFHRWNNRINRLSYDFVVCAKDASVVAVIELDDKSHDSPRRAATDRKKEKATAAAGLRLVRWRVNALPDDVTIRRELGETPPEDIKTPHPPRATDSDPSNCRTGTNAAQR